jgi:hypothetical protein
MVTKGLLDEIKNENFDALPLTDKKVEFTQADFDRAFFLMKVCKYHISFPRNEPLKDGTRFILEGLGSENFELSPVCAVLIKRFCRLEPKKMLVYKFKTILYGKKITFNITGIALHKLSVYKYDKEVYNYLREQFKIREQDRQNKLINL